MSRDPIRLLLVEDNPGDARLIREMLNDDWGKGSFQIRVAGSVDEAMAAINESSPSLLLLDHHQRAVQGRIDPPQSTVEDQGVRGTGDP